jgi:hypothetical protein
VQFAENYAGKSADEMPATTAKIDKNGNLWLCCTRFDDYVPETKPAEDKPKAKGKSKGVTSRKLKTMDDDEDIPFN